LDTPPPATIVARPPAGMCNVQLCCRPLQGVVTYHISAEHCFILVTNSIGQQTYFSGQPGGKTNKCKEALVVFTGPYGSGHECFLPGTVCTSMGNRGCCGPTSVLNCLQGIANWFNTSPVLCYSARGCPNSNNVAYELLSKCAGPPPATAPISPGCGYYGAVCYGPLPPGSGNPAPLPPPTPVPFA